MSHESTQLYFPKEKYPTLSDQDRIILEQKMLWELFKKENRNIPEDIFTKISSTQNNIETLETFKQLVHSDFFKAFLHPSTTYTDIGLYNNGKYIKHFLSKDDIDLLIKNLRIFLASIIDSTSQKKDELEKYYQELSQCIPFNDLVTTYKLFQQINIAKKNIKTQSKKEEEDDERNRDCSTVTLEFMCIYLVGLIFLGIPTFAILVIIHHTALLFAIAVGSAVFALTFCITFVFPLIITIALLTGAYIAIHQNLTDKLNYYDNVDAILDASINVFEHTLAYSENDFCLETTQIKARALLNNYFLLEKNGNNFELYYFSTPDNPIQIPLSEENKTELSNIVGADQLDLDELSTANKEKLKKIIHLDLLSLQNKTQDRDELAELFLSDKCKDSNSTTINNIRAALEKHPRMSSDTFFDLVEKEFKNSLNQNIPQRILSFMFQENIKEKFRHPKIQQLYNLINRSNEQLKNSPQLRKKFIGLINDSNFDLRPQQLSVRLSFSKA